MNIGTFHTAPLQNSEGEWGQIEHEFELDAAVIEASDDPRGFLMMKIAVQLRLLIERTQAPRELWFFSPSDEVRRLTSLPETIPFG